MTFTGNEDHSFPLTTASEWTARYRTSVPTSETIAHFFGKQHMKKLLDQEGCVGMRIYYALDEAGTKQLIITGVDANGDDLYTGLLAEKSARTPPFGGVANPLNS